MKKQKKQKTGNLFIGIALFAILIAIVAWVYIAFQDTKLLINPDKTTYFRIEEPEITINIENPKNATSGEIIIDYPEDKLTLEEWNTPEGASMREAGGKLYFDLSNDFFENEEQYVAHLKFSSKTTGIIEISADEDRSFLNTPEGKLNFGQFGNAIFSVGLSDEPEGVPIQENVGTFEGI